ncbi:MAG: 30S ribosomal protein S6e [Candidatus Nitrosocaldaceae archaeon]|nr:MAG: 30S ribosomal protein S6e [Candidatus Nitrosocaldaceae archaeon]
MVTFKVVISDKNGKARTVEVKDKQAQPFLGLRIGDELDASVIGLQGKLKITGGSDKSGVPMRYDVHGAVKKYILIPKGIGLRKAKEGERRRRLVRGNVISEEIYQINAKLDGVLPEEKKEDAEATA